MLIPSHQSVVKIHLLFALCMRTVVYGRSVPIVAAKITHTKNVGTREREERGESWTVRFGVCRTPVFYIYTELCSQSLSWKCCWIPLAFGNRPSVTSYKPVCSWQSSSSLTLTLLRSSPWRPWWFYIFNWKYQAIVQHSCRIIHTKKTWRLELINQI